jgi:hypothetical protein
MSEFLPRQKRGLLKDVIFKSIKWYGVIFRRVVDAHGLEYDPELLEFLLQRYEKERRPLRCSEPRDLIHRSLDICRYINQPPGLSRDLLELAWINYFGKEKTRDN